MHYLLLGVAILFQVSKLFAELAAPGVVVGRWPFLLVLLLWAACSTLLLRALMTLLLLLRGPSVVSLVGLPSCVEALSRLVLGFGECQVLVHTLDSNINVPNLLGFNIINITNVFLV